MLDREEIFRSLAGAWSLFLDRPDAARFFDISVNGFWRSFRAILLVAPVYALTVIAEYQTIHGDAIADTDFNLSAFIFGNGASVALDWVAFPILLAFASKPLGIARNYSAFIIARNWAAVLAVMPFGALALIYLFGLIGPELLATLSLAVLFVVLRYNYLIASRVLGVPMGFAIGIVAADLAVSLFLLSVVDAIFGL